MKNNLLFIVFDSCRFDSFEQARTPNLSRLGEGERRFSFASWTVPSHTTFLMGVSPHKNPKGVLASEVYKKDFSNWSERLNISDISFSKFVPKLSLPAFLREHGYRTNALVSMPVLNQTTILNTHFDRYQLMKQHNDFSAIVDELEFSSSQPSFYFINVGETHYPYSLPGEKNELPILHGVHGVYKHLDDLVAFPEGNAAAENTAENTAEKDTAKLFDLDTLHSLHQKQRTNVEYLDRLFERIYERAPKNTHIIVTSDHGELFGEDEFFGHGPICHEKVFEVFFVEGMRP